MQTLNPSQLAAPFGRYSHAVAWPAGARLLRSSGQLAIDPHGEIPQAAGDQAALIFEHMDAILREAGMLREQILHITAWVTAREYMADYMTARDAWLAELDELPASTLLIVCGFTRPEFKVEIEILAAG